jgi:hypothetical protein
MSSSLFNSEFAKSAIASLSDEDKRKYKKIGEELYGNINFEDSEVLNNIPPPMEEALAYIKEQLKAGLHPSALEENEKVFLEDAYGEKWYEDWGYTKEDLTEIKTLKIKFDS